MSDLILKAENIVKNFGGVKALKGVNLEIKKGEIHALAGENGCGKSTLIKIISGVHNANGGTVTIDGKVYKNLSPIISAAAGIQVIYQDFSVFPNLTVAENIALGNELQNKGITVNHKKMHQIAIDALAQIGVEIPPDDLVEDRPVADKQLIAISRAIINNAKLLIMDEPTTALTKKEIDSLFKVIKNLQSKGISILFVSHKLEEVFALAEKVTFVRNGENVTTLDINELDRSKFIYYMTGREIHNESYNFTPDTSAAPSLEVKNLSCQGSFKDVSFKVYKGDIVGLCGLLGSGRTELALSLFGMLPPDSGEILINGKPVKINSIDDALKNKIAYVPEDRLTEGLFLEQSIGRNTVTASIDRYCGGSGLIKRKEYDEKIKFWKDELKIKTNNTDLPVKTLSGGNQQRVVLAKWLATEPEILILNGPTVGVDIGSKADIHNYVNKLAGQGMAVFMVSDDISEIIENCNKVLVMKKGKIVYSGEVANTSEEELIELQRKDG